MTWLSRAEQLQQAQREIPLPCCVPLQGPAGVLTLHTSLRLLPGKRLTALAQWQGQWVVAKLFFHPKRWRVYGERDAKGVRSLLDQEILTPSLLLAEPAAIPGLYVVILSYLQDAVSLSAALQQCATFLEKQELLMFVMKTMATLHQKGFLQRDAHFNNFMVEHDRLYVLDGHDICFTKKRLSLKARLNNLAMLLSNLSPTFLDEALPRLLSTYTAANHGGEAYHLPPIEPLLRRIRKKKDKQRQRKITRECTEFVVKKNFFQKMVCDRIVYHETLSAALQDVESLFRDPSAKILKKGNTCTVIRVKIQDRDMVVKRYQHQSVWQGMRWMLKPSRALRSWRNAHRLQSLEIAVARPIAYVEKRYGRWPLQAYYVCDYVPGLSLHETAEVWLTQSWQPVLHVLKQLAAAQLTHGDMKATNFLVTPQRVVLIDLDSMKKSRLYYQWRFLWRRDMQRLLKNWVQQPSIYQGLLQQLSQEHLL